MPHPSLKKKKKNWTTPYSAATHAFRDGPVCGVGFFLNKFISYLSLCLSLNSFCDDIKKLSFIKSWDEVCDIS